MDIRTEAEHGMTPHEHQKLISRISAELNALAVAAEVEETLGARVQAWAPKDAPARSAEHGLPTLDAYDRWLLHKADAYAREMAVAYKALDRALGYQTELLERLTPEQARLVAEGDVEDGVTCANASCGVVIDRSKERCVSGRCFPCYEYRRRHGNDAPPTVIERRTAQ